MTRARVSDRRVCELPGCERSLDGHRATARYCCDAHRTAAYRARERVTVEGTASGGRRRPLSARVVRYANGYEITLGIGDVDGSRSARAAILLTPEQASELARAMLGFAADAESNGVNGGGGLANGWALNAVEAPQVESEAAKVENETALVRRCRVLS
jgi:hypothetical protein